MATTTKAAPAFAVGDRVLRHHDRVEGEVVDVQEYDGDFAYGVRLYRPQYDEEFNTVLGTRKAWVALHADLHAHVTTESRDCDGTYHAERVVRIDDKEAVDQFGDIDFKARVVGDVVSTHSVGTLSVHPDGARWEEPTEEGYRNQEVEWCTLGCK